MNKLEIERRYILKNLPLELKEPTYSIDQAYGKDSTGIFRIRCRVKPTSEVDYFITRKKMISIGVFEEYETTIDARTYHSYYDECQTILYKSRFNVEFNNLIFEIDLFDNGLVIMEVELPDIEFPIIMPEFIEDLVVEDITGRQELSNHSMSQPMSK